MNAPFTVQAEELDDGICAFTLAGELDHATAPDLREPLDSAIEEGIKCVLIDLSDCTFIDSTGLSVIVHAHSALIDGSNPGQLEICCPDPQVRRLLEITGVDRALGLHQTRDEAVEALKAAAA